MLQVVADRMHGAVRSTDTVGRISGDEFIIACEGIASGEGAALEALTAVGQRIRHAVARPIPLQHVATPTSITFTASIGIAVTTDRPTPAELIHTADQAMYQAKAARRNDVVTLHHR